MRKNAGKLDPIFVGGLLVFLVVCAISNLWAANITPNMGAAQMVQAGWIKVISGAIGFLFMLILLFVSVSTIRKRGICPSCGAKSPNASDRFCRICGSTLSKP